MKKLDIKDQFNLALAQADFDEIAVLQKDIILRVLERSQQLDSIFAGEGSVDIETNIELMKLIGDSLRGMESGMGFLARASNVIEDCLEEDKNEHGS